MYMSTVHFWVHVFVNITQILGVSNEARSLSIAAPPSY